MECFRGPGTVFDVDTMNTLYNSSTESLQPSGKVTFTLYLNTGGVNSQPNVSSHTGSTYKGPKSTKGMMYFKASISRAVYQDTVPQDCKDWKQAKARSPKAFLITVEIWGFHFLKIV